MNGRSLRIHRDIYTRFKNQQSLRGRFSGLHRPINYIPSPMPRNSSYESTAVLPLGLSTTSYGQFQKDCLALQHSSVRPISTGKMLFVWGGSMSLGSNGVQLAVAAGHGVITNALPIIFRFSRIYYLITARYLRYVTARPIICFP